MPYFEYNAHRLFYAHHKGPQERPSLLLIHGAGGNRTHWPKALRPLPGFDTIVIDLPGHGRSDPPGYNTITAYADAVTAFINWHQRPLVPVGHSMGGGIAQIIAQRQLPQVVGLVLIGTSARLPVGQVILDNAIADPQKAIDFIARYAWSTTAPAEMSDLTRQALAEIPPTILHGDFVACNRFDLTGQLSAIDLPALVISGSEDKMTPAKYGRFLADELPNAQYYCLEGAGHYMIMEQPAQVAAMMQQFLDVVV